MLISYLFLYFYFFFFFFFFSSRRRHTRSYGDWSSDVCSSDLKPDAIGLSGLLVKSTHQMVITATDLKAAGIAVPLLVGGARSEERRVGKGVDLGGGRIIKKKKEEDERWSKKQRKK